MLSKRSVRARIALVCLLFAGCQSVLSRAVERTSQREEVNVAFAIEDNLLRLTTVTVDGRQGRFFLGSAHPRTLVNPAFAGGAQPEAYRIQLNDRESLDLQPVLVDLHGIGDAIIGFDAWGSQAISVNYVSGLVTYLRKGIDRDGVTIYQYQGEPAISLTVNGQMVDAIVDTASPDTLVLPRGTAAAGRTNARVDIAGTTFPSIDIALDDVTRARVGNRLLSKFLLSIDYGRQQVGLWRDPRIALQ